MATRDGRRLFAIVAAAVPLACCSVANLTYAEVERDLNAIVEVEGSGQDQHLKYRSDVEISPWYSKWALLWPFKPLLLLFLPDVSRQPLENPSGHVRDLLGELAPKAGADLQRCVASVRRCVRTLELDSSALNRITALDGLATIAAALDIDVMVGLDGGRQRLEPPAEAAGWRRTFVTMHPSQRQPPGSELPAAEAAIYRSALTALCSQPLPTWHDRLALVGDLAAALPAEPDTELRAATRSGLLLALRHALQWSIVEALAGQEPALVDVRLRALELLHRAGGPDAVPLLLSLMVNSPERKAAGEPDFDPDPMMQLRLIHLCGQLDEARASTSLRLPGQMAWQAVAPAEFLARIVLENADESMALLAREALAHCLRRPHLRLDTDPDDASSDWVVEWRERFLREQSGR